MQGRKTFEDERELLFPLSAHVPEHNFYRRLKQQLDLDFLYELTQKYYGRCGQQSIDPVVFFKLCLISYLENITTQKPFLSGKAFGFKRRTHCQLQVLLIAAPIPVAVPVSPVQVSIPSSMIPVMPSAVTIAVIPVPIAVLFVPVPVFPLFMAALPFLFPALPVLLPTLVFFLPPFPVSF